MECTKTLYNTIVTSQPLPIDAMCGDFGRGYRAYFTYEAMPRSFIRSFQRIVFGKDKNPEEVCRNAMERLAIVRINLASNVVTRITRNKRVTITDHIANIGTRYDFETKVF